MMSIFYFFIGFYIGVAFYIYIGTRKYEIRNNIKNRIPENKLIISSFKWPKIIFD